VLEKGPRGSRNSSIERIKLFQVFERPGASASDPSATSRYSRTRRAPRGGGVRRVAVRKHPSGSASGRKRRGTVAQRPRGLGLSSSVSITARAASVSGCAACARDRAASARWRRPARAWHVDDALEARSSVANARPADRRARRGFPGARRSAARRSRDRAGESDEAILELAHLERGAHQDRDLVERWGRPEPSLRCNCSITSPMARASSSESSRRSPAPFRRLVLGAERLAEPPSLWR